MGSMHRRQLLIAAAGAFPPHFAVGQPHARQPAIGFLIPTAVSPARWANSNYARRLRELGWIDGTNIVVERASADADEGRYAAPAEELVRKRVDVILAHGPEAAVAAARASRTIPIVFMGVISPIELGLVASLARPTGNVTGVAWNVEGELQAAKPLEALTQIVPSVKRLALIARPSSSPTVAGAVYAYPDFKASVRNQGFDAQAYQVIREEDFDGAFARILESRAQAIYVVTEPFVSRHGQRIVDFANQNRLPSAFDAGLFVDMGGLVSYGPYAIALIRRSIDYADRILRGARPGDLPVELPTKFELVLNLKTAKALDLTVPRSMLARADRLIE